jgi:hypothetical protein
LTTEADQDGCGETPVIPRSDLRAAPRDLGCCHLGGLTPAALAELANVLPDPMAQHMHATIQRLATRQEDGSIDEALALLNALEWAVRAERAAVACLSTYASW